MRPRKPPAPPRRPEEQERSLSAPCQSATRAQWSRRRSGAPSPRRQGRRRAAGRPAAALRRDRPSWKSLTVARGLTDPSLFRSRSRSRSWPAQLAATVDQHLHRLIVSYHKKQQAAKEKRRLLKARIRVLEASLEKQR